MEKNHLLASENITLTSLLFIFLLIVRYIPSSSEHPTVPRNRMEIFEGDYIGTYQPETDGYVVCFVDRGM